MKVFFYILRHYVTKRGAFVVRYTKIKYELVVTDKKILYITEKIDMNHSAIFCKGVGQIGVLDIGHVIPSKLSKI